MKYLTGGANNLREADVIVMNVGVTKLPGDPKIFLSSGNECRWAAAYLAHI
jgi:hypothetical protein